MLCVHIVSAIISDFVTRFSPSRWVNAHKLHIIQQLIVEWHGQMDFLEPLESLDRRKKNRLFYLLIKSTYQMWPLKFECFMTVAVYTENYQIKLLQPDVIRKWNARNVYFLCSSLKQFFWAKIYFPTGIAGIVISFGFKLFSVELIILYLNVLSMPFEWAWINGRQFDDMVYTSFHRKQWHTSRKRTKHK